MPSIEDVAKENMSVDDEILLEYRGKLDDQDGALLITKEKILFIQEKGFFKKTYNYLIDVTHSDVDISKGGGGLEFKLEDGKMHSFKTYRLSVDIITFEYNQMKDKGMLIF